MTAIWIGSMVAMLVRIYFGFVVLLSCAGVAVVAHSLSEIRCFKYLQSIACIVGRTVMLCRIGSDESYFAFLPFGLMTIDAIAFCRTIVNDSNAGRAFITVTE